MKDRLSKSSMDSIRQEWDDLETPGFQVPKILLPISLGIQSQVDGFFALENHDLPPSGQKHLNEITGTPFKAELAGLTVFFGTILPPLQESYTRTLIMLADSIDSCDQSKHSQSTSIWAAKIAEQIKLPEDDIQCIGLAGKLHDIGKSVVSKDILTKPAPLSKKEWEIIKQHPGYSAALMDPSPGLHPLQPMVRWHHEHFNGNGYPDGLSGSHIPLGARILAVADAFSTMTNARAYRSPVSHEAAYAELLRCRGTQFDPEIVDVMTACLGF